MANEEEKVVEEEQTQEEEKKTPFKDLPFEDQIAVLDEKITKTKERVEKLTKSLTKAKTDVINLENQKKAIKWDKDHPEEKEEKKKDK